MNNTAKLEMKQDRQLETDTQVFSPHGPDCPPVEVIVGDRAVQTFEIFAGHVWRVRRISHTRRLSLLDIDTLNFCIHDHVQPAKFHMDFSSQNMSPNNYRRRSAGDNVIGSVRPSVRLSVRPLALSS